MGDSPQRGNGHYGPVQIFCRSCGEVVEPAADALLVAVAPAALGAPCMQSHDAQFLDAWSWAEPAARASAGVRTTARAAKREPMERRIIVVDLQARCSG